MANNVIKKDGSKEPFDEAKIRKSIETAVRGGGLPDEKVAELVEQITPLALQVAEGKEEVTTSELRDRILSELDSVAPAASASWRKHDEEKTEEEGEKEGEEKVEKEGEEV